MATMIRIGRKPGEGEMGVGGSSVKEAHEPSAEEIAAMPHIFPFRTPKKTTASSAAKTNGKSRRLH